MKLAMHLRRPRYCAGSQEKIDSFLPLLGEMFGDGMVTLEPVTVLHYNGAFATYEDR